MKRIAVVTGANRGLGYETCRQLAKRDYHVVLTSRDEAKGQEAVSRLSAEGGAIEFRRLDVTAETGDASPGALVSWLKEKHGRIDVLVNNAGILPDSKQVGVDAIRKAMETNVYGPYRLCQAVVPWMMERGYGRIVNVSSGMGQLQEMNAGYPAYRISKTALNALTRIFSEEARSQEGGRGTNVLVNSVCPGWVKTDMGGPEAERSVEQGVETLVWLATLDDGGPTGGFFRDREPIAW